MNTPILFLVFNRLDTTKVVFEAIRKARPSKLYVSADGSRNDIESIACNKVRDFILNSVDWDCEVKTNFSPINKGCKIAVSDGISWFFEQEEYGIVLEDDCLPNSSFFQFCEDLLLRYRDNKKVWHIGGINFDSIEDENKISYIYSMYTNIWGWASWRDRWHNYKVDIQSYHLKNDLEKYTHDKRVYNYFKKKQNQVAEGIINTWDYQYIFHMWENDGLAIIPSLNLVSNIGFSLDSTNTLSDSNLSSIETYSYTDIKFNDNIVRDKKFDKYYFYNYIYPNIFIRFSNFIKLKLAEFKKRTRKS